MRKLIVKHFALNYTIKIFGIQSTALRASRVIFPTFILGAILTFINPQYPTPTWYTLTAYALMAISVFFGFIYFKISPVKWHELDDAQKWQYGFTVRTKLISKPKEFYNDINWDEWEILNAKFSKQ